MKLDWRPDEHNFFLAAKNIKVDLDLKVRLDKIGSDETWSGAKKKVAFETNSANIFTIGNYWSVRNSGIRAIIAKDGVET